MTSLPIIDAHHHFWDLSLKKHPWLLKGNQIKFRYGNYSALKTNYLLEDYKKDSINQNIKKTIHVEGEWDPSDPVGESTWLLNYYEKTGYPNAIVGQVWFMRDDIENLLKLQAQNPLMRSVRQKPKTSLSPKTFALGMQGAMSDLKFREGYKLLQNYKLHYDLQAPWWHLGEAANLATDFPDTVIILNHAGLPSDRSDVGLSLWHENMEDFASQPNTAVKISGICVPEKSWNPKLNKNIVLDTIRIFGTDRCMFASNFPVDRLLASFDDIFNGFKNITKDFSFEDRQKLFYSNALKYYSPC